MKPRFPRTPSMEGESRSPTPDDDQDQKSSHAGGEAVKDDARNEATGGTKPGMDALNQAKNREAPDCHARLRTELAQLAAESGCDVAWQREALVELALAEAEKTAPSSAEAEGAEDFAGRARATLRARTEVRTRCKSALTAALRENVFARIARKRFGCSWPEALDIQQEAGLRIWQRLLEFRDGLHPSAWFFAFVPRVFCDVRRRWLGRVEPDGFSEESAPSSEEMSPEELTASLELEVELRQLLSEYEEQRRIFLDREEARDRGEPMPPCSGTARSLLSRSFAEVRQRLIRRGFLNRPRRRALAAPRPRRRRSAATGLVPHRQHSQEPRKRRSRASPPKDEE